MNSQYDELNSSLIEDVRRQISENGDSTENAFTSVFISYLTEHGETKVANSTVAYCSNSQDKVKVNAYAYDEYFQTLTLVVSLYNNRCEIAKLNKTDATKICKQATKMAKMCLSKSPSELQELEESGNIYKLYEFISGLPSIDNISIILLTNKIAGKEIPEDTAINKIPVKYDIWDIERLAQIVFQKRDTEKLVIRFKTKYKYDLKLIKVPQDNSIYDSYVGYISGTCLAQIYKDEGQKLIEKNVRSFLQAHGKVNRGIRDTLKSNSQMFMAYNNGISTTAEDIVIDESNVHSGLVTIKEIHGWQIVNGGRTTASVYTAMQAKIPLDDVFIQIKLTVIKNKEKTDEIISSISKYANSQNKITMSDFSANDDFHIELERLSRKVYVPAERGKSTKRWFYERARGQYTVELNRQPTQGEKKKFKEQNPKENCVSKTVAAKCAMCWLQHPDIVSKGLESNFVIYSEMIAEGTIHKPDESFYTKMIAQVILFQHCDKIVAEQNFMGYKANINYYTIALLSKYNADKVNFDEIWRTQTLSPELCNLIKDLCYTVHNHLTNPGEENKGINITQCCKKVECWTLLQNRFENHSI